MSHTVIKKYLRRYVYIYIYKEISITTCGYNSSLKTNVCSTILLVDSYIDTSRFFFLIFTGCFLKVSLLLGELSRQLRFGEQGKKHLPGPSCNLNLLKKNF